MNKNVRKVFDILGVEPNERFKIEDFEEDVFYFDEKLCIGRIGGNIGSIGDVVLRGILNGTFKIIKLPKKKKLRDLTEEEFDKWKDKNCLITDSCDYCCFKSVVCSRTNECWVKHKDLYSDKFLDQEIEVEE